MFSASVDGRTQLMGILNVTPDSFSDGGRHLRVDDAIAAARRMVLEGADIIDIGAESTRPGHAPVSADEETRRLAPVVNSVVALGRPVSVDTTKANVAAFALGEGASIINDIWGLQKDEGMAPLAATRGVQVVVMHNREAVDETIDIIDDMHAFFRQSMAIAEGAGLPKTKLILDPGIGFGKSHAQNLIALKRLGELQCHGLPILVGASRKSFIGKIHDSTPDQRLPGTLAAHLLAARTGASLLRVHDVAETRQALDVDVAIARA